ncbi:MAG: DUF5615 family PIN-like protein [Bryobacteraceae bacterium]|nr:DUF5615 family PIN-like protein [Bryobacteraceae bacterium]
MKLLLDQGLPRSAATLLREAGIETVHAGELGMSMADDELIIEHARENGHCIVTLDADFHALIATCGGGAPLVIRLRMQRLKARDAADMIQAVLERVGRELSAGCFVTVTEEAIRIRRLPIRPSA